MATLDVTIKHHGTMPPRRSEKILIEIDRDKFERIAAHLGLFSKEFLASIARAENDVKARKIRRIRSLKELR